MKLYVLTKHEDAKMVAYQWPSDPTIDRGDFEGLVILHWGQVFASLGGAQRFALDLVSADFASLLASTPVITWQVDLPSMTATVQLDGPDGMMTLSFRVRGQDVDVSQSPVYLVSLTDPPTDVNDALDNGLLYASRDEAKSAVYRDLGINEAEAHWDSHWETNVERPGVMNKIITTCTIWGDEDRLYPKEAK